MIIFLYGEDTFRSRQKLNELKDKFLREVDASGNDLSVIEGETTSIEKINERVGPASLFSRARMIVIENLFLNKNQNLFKQVSDFLKKSARNENILIFYESFGGSEKLNKDKEELFKFLLKQKYSLPEFKPLTQAGVSAWAKKEVEKRGGKITQGALSALTGILRNDLWQIEIEIEKLINFKAGQKLNLPGEIEIGLADVENMVKGRFDENIFALTDAISAKNKASAVKLLEEQFDAGAADMYLLSMITRQFRILLEIRQALDAGYSSKKIISVLKLHPFIVQKGINQVRNFSLERLKKIFNKLVECDYFLKSGKGDLKTGLDLLITKM